MNLPHGNTINAFWKHLFAWFSDHGRDLPWRDTDDPYEILVSEIMLQQTQVERVKEKWPAFLEQFPTVQALARASRGDVLQAWQGLGYNRRALNLHTAAQVVVAEHARLVPQARNELRALPGVGEYTASAVRVFAFNAPDVAVDVNVRRVLGRHLFDGTLPSSDFLRDHTARLIPHGRFRHAHNALMDLGATQCTASATACSLWRCTPLTEEPRRRREEPMHRGTPRRIWRGRLVELLREHDRLNRRTAMEKLFDGISEEDRRFMDDIIDRLENEGMVTVTDETVMFPQ